MVTCVTYALVTCGDIAWRVQYLRTKDAHKQLARTSLRVLLTLNQKYPGTIFLFAIIKKFHHFMS